MKQRQVALIIFYDDEGNILLQDRRDISRRGEEWGLFGGGIEPDETPSQAIIREVREELCYDLQEFAFVGHVDGRVTEDGPIVLHGWLFAAPLPDMALFDQREGQGMQVYSLEAAHNLRTIYGDYAVFDLFRDWFQRK